MGTELVTGGGDAPGSREAVRMGTSGRSVRRPGILLAACLPLGVMLSGCAPEPEPMPTVEWSPSEPAGAFEDTDWVRTIRAYELEVALAFNRHDFTSTALLALSSSLDVSLMADRARSAAERGEHRSYPGPLSFTVIGLTDKGGTARVRVCQPSTAWLISTDHPEFSIDGATEAVYNLARTESGSIRIESTGGSDTPCDPSGIPIGLFDLQPDVTATYSVDDVKEP